jgi:hypothetical protein
MRGEIMKTGRTIALGLMSLAILISVGCAEESPKKVPMQFVKNERIKDSGGNKVSFNRAVDILFVIDDSGSMSDHQANLAKNVKLFTQGILANQILDYHIGVVTSNMDTPPYNPVPGSAWKGELWGTTKFVSRTTPSGQTTLESNLQPGTNGSGTEMFFTPVQAALTVPMLTGPNSGFYRPDAYLAIIFLTDADDQSNLSASDFYKFLLNLKGGDPSKIISYGVNIPTVDKVCSRSGEPEPQKLEAFYKLTAAKTLDLCDVDYGTKLAALGDDLVRRVGSVLYLTRPAQPNTITVTFGSQVLPNDAKTGWIYDPTRNGLIFGDEIDLQPEPPGTQVEVDFIAAEY